MNGEADTIIEIRGVTKRFGNVVTAVDDVSLDIRSGEFFALLGPSGCGKTTLLRILAGFESPTLGEVRIAGRNVAGVPPNRRDVNMVFQSYAVFPHMTVADNVGYGLKVTGTPKAEIDSRVDEALALVQLGGYGGRKPDQLSGGQRQRVALARALVKKPQVLLLDEPLSALDAKLREAMQLELVGLQHAVGITFVIVTHDQDEALSMADRIAVMDSGRVRQVAPPEELYEFPSSRFVADFIGKMNLFQGRVTRGANDNSEVDVEGLGAVRLPPGRSLSGEIGIAVRPEKVKVSAERPQSEAVAFEARLDNIAYHGSESHLFLTTDGGVRIAVTLQNDSRSVTRYQAGERLWVSWAPTDTLVLED
ncbi:MAG TPA: ABC transporter ATP-binding protein [Gammaproteobacteria bacterium]|nr:ABC transporter ATP-binding protein [Gammaproteobacteria bacterium]